MTGAVTSEALGKLYPSGVWGIEEVTFEAKERGILVLLGPNGSGKSTTIHILATLLKPTRGKGVVAGYDVVKDADKVRKKIAIMPQDGRPDPNWTPYEAVCYYLLARGSPPSCAKQEAKRWLEELELWEVRNTPGWELSGGQRRRTLVAMILATDAEVIFLDEPTEAVDVEGKYKIWGAVKRAVKSGRSVVYTTHNMREAEHVADMVVILFEGRSVLSGTPSELVESLPFRYRVVTSGFLPSGAKFWVKMGETFISYFDSFSEAKAVMREDSRATVEQVSLEDAYLYYTKGVRR